MNLVVRYLRLTMIAGFAILAMVCVSYAHSEELDVQTYHSAYPLLGGCQMKVQHVKGGVVRIKISDSRTLFETTDVQGEVLYLHSGETTGEQLIGVEALRPREELIVSMQKDAGGKYQPASYQYVPNYLNSMRKGMDFSKNCFLKAD